MSAGRLMKKRNYQVKTKSPLPLSHRFLAISRYLELAATKVKPIHDLSHKAVPAGPNPLHN
ncbi:hypothetical protein Patl1_20103 [Pistacia atlantica]|uniref:Uncharacterized protein n=1 Tax=Pistacia atlantica TaxID=434234 RepID=A0ACC1BMD8_9ROSI|nr:hypothetical protein Patl1_20103 [Pistacia atlantica]